MSVYAQDTKVSEQRSREEIEKTIKRYGATAFAYATRDYEATVVFEMHNLRLKFYVELPTLNDPAFAKTPTGKPRTAAAHRAAFERGTRQKWRALALAIKAKLESVKTGISTFEEEFLANIVMPDGETVGRWVLPHIAQAHRTGQMPQLGSGEK